MRAAALAAMIFSGGAARGRVRVFARGRGCVAAGVAVGNLPMVLRTLDKMTAHFPQHLSRTTILWQAGDLHREPPPH